MRTLSWLVCLFLGASALANGVLELSLDEAKQMVAGQSQKVWVLERVEEYLNQAGKCVSGEQYTFHQDGSMQIKKCVESAWQTRDATWRIEDRDEIDRYMWIDEEAFELKLREEGSIETMRLANPPSIKSEATVARILQHARD